MYLLVYAPVSNWLIQDNWKVINEFPTITEACQAMAAKTRLDIEHNEHYTYMVKEFF